MAQQFNNVRGTSLDTSVISHSIERTHHTLFPADFYLPMLAQRLRRWPSIETTLGRRLKFAGYEILISFEDGTSHNNLGG